MCQMDRLADTVDGFQESGTPVDQIWGSSKKLKWLLWNLGAELRELSRLTAMFGIPVWKLGGTGEIYGPGYICPTKRIKSNRLNAQKREFNM